MFNMRRKGALKGSKMQRTAPQPAIEAERDRAQRAKYAKLTAHYGKIGSGALNAALIYVRQQKAAAKLATKAR